MTPPYFWIFVIISPLKRTWPLNCTILNSLYLRMICKNFDWNWPAGSREDFFFFKCSINFYSFAIISPWGRSCFSFVEFWIPFAQEYFVPSLFKIGSVVLEKNIFKWPHPIFWIFVIISPLKRTWLLTCAILNSLYLRMICIKFDWNWPAGSREEFFFKCFMNFYSFLSSPLGEGVVLHLYNSESPLPKDTLCQIWLKLV
jgi:hypothetical protein